MNVNELLVYDLLDNTVVVPVIKEVAKKIFIEQEPESIYKNRKTEQLNVFNVL